MRWNRESSQGLTNYVRYIDRLRQDLPQSFVLQRSTVSVESCVVGYETGDFVITGCELRLATQGFGVSG